MNSIYCLGIERLVQWENEQRYLLKLTAEGEQDK